MNKPYGQELILDIHNVPMERFTEDYLREFCECLCRQIDMKAMQFNIWKYEDEDEYQKAPPHLKGISAIQFIETSGIIIHALDDLKQVHLNIFSCKPLKAQIVKTLAKAYFGGDIVNEVELDRL